MGTSKLDLRFNRELERYKAGYMLPNEVFHLGKPQGVLQLFLPNLPIVMRPRVMRKGSEKKHDVDIDALVDMPRKISAPIFIFQRDEKSIGLLTEMTDRAGKNVCVAIEMNKTFQEGNTYLKVNDVRSFHGRDIENIINPILNNNTLVWVDKEKGLDWLTSASQPVQQALDTSTLLLCAKIIKEFENPKHPKDYITEIDTNLLDRITDVSVYPVKNLGYAIRCQIDGVKQMSVRLSDEDAASVHPNMDKRLLASKYFKDELDLNDDLSLDTSISSDNIYSRMNDQFIFDPHDLSGNKEVWYLSFRHFAFHSSAEKWDKATREWKNPLRVGIMFLAERKGSTPSRNVSITVATTSFLPGQKPDVIRMTTQEADEDFVRQLIGQGFATFVRDGVERHQDYPGAEIEEFPWVRIDVTDFYNRYMQEHERMAMDSPISHVFQCHGQVMNGRDTADYMTCRIEGIEQPRKWSGVTGREFFRVAELYPDCRFHLTELAADAFSDRMELYRQAQQRVTDANLLFHKGTHYLRCRIDGEQQLMKPLERLDVSDFQISKDIHALAAKYYESELSDGIRQGRSLGR